MKKIITSAAALVFISGTVLLTSCSKEDTTAPVITLKGDASVYSVLNAAYTDMGATATDDEDGDLTSSITVTTSAVNKDLAGSYTVTYSVTDAAGNEGTASRTVIVRNDAYVWAGSYAVKDSCAPTIIFNYNQTITASNTVNNRLNFNKFADYSGNTNIYATITGTTIDLPSQSATGIGTKSENHTFNGTGNKTATGFKLTYTDNNTSNSSSATCVAVFTKQ